MNQLVFKHRLEHQKEDMYLAIMNALYEHYMKGNDIECNIYVKLKDLEISKLYIDYEHFETGDVVNYVAVKSNKGERHLFADFSGLEVLTIWHAFIGVMLNDATWEPTRPNPIIEYITNEDQLMMSLGDIGTTKLLDLIQAEKCGYDAILEDEIYIENLELFGDDETHECVCVCYDGYALCQEVGTDMTFKMTYPKLEDIQDDGDACEEIRKYRGLPHIESIHYGDIMMAYGECVKL